MSLINDALKRVKAAQQQAPPSASVDLQFKPVEPAPRTRAGVGVWMPVVFAAIAVVGLAIGWRLLRQNDSVPAITVRAAEPAARASAAPLETRSQTEPSAPTPAPGRSLAANGLKTDSPAHSSSNRTPLSEPAGEHSPATGDIHVVAGSPATGGTNSETKRTTDGAVAQNSDTNHSSLSSNGTNATAALVAPTPPKPPPLRLQGIIFNPRRPSAVISGRTVFIGDRVREMRVVAIGQDTATLAGAGRTNVLTMAE